MGCPLWSHALKLKENDPLDSLLALQCRTLGADIFFWSSWGSHTSSLENVSMLQSALTTAQWPHMISPWHLCSLSDFLPWSHGAHAYFSLWDLAWPFSSLKQGWQQSWTRNGPLHQTLGGNSPWPWFVADWKATCTKWSKYAKWCSNFIYIFAWMYMCKHAKELHVDKSSSSCLVQFFLWCTIMSIMGDTCIYKWLGHDAVSDLTLDMPSPFGEHNFSHGS